MQISSQTCRLSERCVMLASSPAHTARQPVCIGFLRPQNYGNLLSKRLKRKGFPPTHNVGAKQKTRNAFLNMRTSIIATEDYNSYCSYYTAVPGTKRHHLLYVVIE
jgi:hypothetical protein